MRLPMRPMRGVRRSGELHRPALGRDRGAVALEVVLFLPAVIALVAILLNLGIIFLTKYRLQTAVDLGALAAVQDVDLEALADGRRVLLVDQARKDATDITLRNLGYLGSALNEAQVSVAVHNVDKPVRERDDWTGKTIEEPTVCVRAQAPGWGMTLALASLKVRLEVHADASVLERH